LAIIVVCVFEGLLLSHSRMEENLQMIELMHEVGGRLITHTLSLSLSLSHTHTNTHLLANNA
jgi:hypothetical protein